MESRGSVCLALPTMGERQEWLRLTCMSVAAQSAPLVCVIVGPADKGLDKLADSFGFKFLSEPPRGLSAAINAAFNEYGRKCDFFSWIGDDDLLRPDSIEVVKNALMQKPSASFAYGRTMYIDGSGNSIYRSYPTRFAPLYARWGQDYIPQPGSLVRTSAVDGPTLVDSSLRNAMDLDLFLRLAAPGTSSWVYVRREVSAYRIHDEAITQTKGASDESEIVRDRYRGQRGQKWARRLAPLRRAIEKAYVWMLWHSPTPRDPYVAPHEVSRLRVVGRNPRVADE